MLCAARWSRRRPWLATAAQQADPPTRRSVLGPGVHRGPGRPRRRNLGRQCVECHGSGLDGDAVSEIPALTGDPFMQRWSTRSLDELWLICSDHAALGAGSLTRAPVRGPGRHLLKSNGFPSGFDALGTDSERLRQIRHSAHARRASIGPSEQQRLDAVRVHARLARRPREHREAPVLRGHQRHRAVLIVDELRGRQVARAAEICRRDDRRRRRPRSARSPSPAPPAASRGGG